MNWIYLPIAAPDLDEFADLLLVRDQQEAMLRARELKYRRCDRTVESDPSSVVPDPPLSAVADGDKVWVILHGRRSTANDVGGIVDGAAVLMTAAELADRMQGDGLDPARRVDIKLYVCYAGMSRTKKKWGFLSVGKEAPFGGQLYAALRKRGHANKRVAGYRGALQMIPYNAPHKLVSEGLRGPPLNARLAAPESRAWNEDQGTFDVDGISRASDPRMKVWFDEAWFLANQHRLPRALR